MPTNNNSNGAGSLDNAVAIASSGDIIDLSTITGTIFFTDQLLIDENLDIQ